jgi:hypothetical protein
MAIKQIFEQVAGKIIDKPSVTDSKGSGFKQKNLPWNKNSDAFLPPVKILPERAQELYPYRLLVIDATNGRVIGSNGSAVKSNDAITAIHYNKETGGVIFAPSENASKKWQITLPITPQQLSITDQFAINTTATMRGIVEEHNGVKFKMISASGTTGIWPTRTNFEDPNSQRGISLFGGTGEALGQLLSAVNTFTNNGKTKPEPGNPANDHGGQGTGYFQAILIQQFLEQYAMAKKDPKNKHWRLVFDCPKTNESFIVTPVQFTMSKNQRSPGESLYTMQFKAWKRIDLKAGEKFKKGTLKKLEPNAFQQIITAIDNARNVMSAAKNVVKAVRADVKAPFDQLRKVSLLIKDTAGLATSVADLPSDIVKDVSSSMDEIMSDPANLERLSIDSSFISDAGLDLIRSRAVHEGMSLEDVMLGGLGVAAKNSLSISPYKDISDNPEEYFDVLSQINVDDLDLKPQQKLAIQDAIELNSLMSIKEIKDIIKDIQDLTLDISNNFGAGDSFFSTVYNRPAPKTRTTPMTIEEFELLRALEDAVLNMNLLVATRDLDDNRTQSPLEYVGGLADDAEIPFDSSSSAKYLAPVPFGLTMQQISHRYLGDADRYNEIITLNNLRSPYIDEEGFFYNFLSNGDGRQFNVSTNNNLYVGQKIQLSSNSVPLFSRKIIGIQKITDTNYLITVDGEADLSSLTTVANAKMKAYLPGTVNSQNQIYIPSNETIEEQSRTFDIPYLKGDTLTDLSKIDWLLSEQGDVVLNSFGDANLATGTNNLIQILRMMVSTRKGEILSEPDFGLGLNPGVNVADLEYGTILSDLRGIILSDSRFEEVEKLEVNILPPDLSITINVRLSGGRGIFPINFSVPY